MKRLIVLRMALLCGISAQAANGPVKLIKPLKQAGNKKLNVVYKNVDEMDMLLDFYAPPAEFTGPRPVIFYTHGGGWAAGSKRGVSNASFGVVFNRLLDKGFAVVSIEYRLWRKAGTSTIRDCVIDSKDAVRFIAKNSAEFGVDPQRCFVLGDSAGGQLAQMLILSPPKSLPVTTLGLWMRLLIRPAVKSSIEPSSFSPIIAFEEKREGLDSTIPVL